MTRSKKPDGYVDVDIDWSRVIAYEDASKTACGVVIYEDMTGMFTTMLSNEVKWVPAYGYYVTKFKIDDVLLYWNVALRKYIYLSSTSLNNSLLKKLAEFELEKAIVG